MSVLWQHRRSNQQEALGFFGVEGIRAKKSKIKASCRIGTRVLRVKASSNSGVSSQISTAIPILDSFMSFVVISHELVFLWTLWSITPHHSSRESVNPPAWQKCSTQWQAGSVRHGLVKLQHTRAETRGVKGHEESQTSVEEFCPPAPLWENIWNLLRHKSET